MLRSASLVFLVLLMVPIRMLLAQDWGEVKRSIRGAFPEVRQAPVDTVAAWLDGPDAASITLLDARAPAEYAVSHLRGARRVDPDSAGAASLDDLPRDARIVVYCSVGYRSSQTARRLQRQGFTNVVNLEGSIFEWANRGHPVYRDGAPVRVVHPYNRRWGRLLDPDLHAYEPASSN